MNSRTLSEESEENRSLSKFVRQRRKKSPNSKSKSKWNPFKKIAKIVTGGSSPTISSEATDVLAEDCVMRWTSTCLNATCPIFAKNPQFNMIYCTIPSLLMFIVVKFASESIGAKFMDRLFDLSDQDLTELAEICQILQKCSSNNNFYCFVRFLVDEEKTTTVSKELMAQCQKLANYKIFASIRPSRAIKYLNSLSFGALETGSNEISRPALLTTNGYGSCGLVAKWNGKTKSIGLQRFASTYHRMIMEPFFELSTKFRRISDEHFEIFEIDFENSKNPGSLLIFRPHFIGNLAYSNRTIKSETIAKIMTKLEGCEKTKGTILLPKFCVNSNHDLWKNLLRQGVQPDLGQSQKLPPIASLHHWTNICVNEKGISAKIEGEKKKQKKLEHGRIPLLYEKHRPYAARIDSSFSYIFLLKGIPIFTGSYFGSFPPRSSEIFIKLPNQVRKNGKKSAPRKKAYVKPTRRQNLRKKAAKNDAKNREKFKKHVSKSTETEESKSSSISTSISKSGSAEPKSKSKNSKIQKVFNFFRRKK